MFDSVCPLAAGATQPQAHIRDVWGRGLEHEGPRVMVNKWTALTSLPAWLLWRAQTPLVSEHESDHDEKPNNAVPTDLPDAAARRLRSNQHFCNVDNY